MRKGNGKVATAVRLGKTARKAPGAAGQLPAEHTSKKLSLPCMINGHEPRTPKDFQTAPCKWCGRLMYWVLHQGPGAMYSVVQGAR